MSVTGTVTNVSPLAKRFERFSEADIDAEIVVMRLDNGDFFSLSETSAAIWRLIDGTRDRGAVFDALKGQFDGDEGEIATDLDEFIAQLKSLGLLGD